MKKFLYILCQCTWGVIQTLLGLVVFLCHSKDNHYIYHGAVVTEWKDRSSVSLGLFVFVTSEPYFYDKLKGDYTMDELSARLLFHEYGHTIQSLILGPLYLIIIGLPSTLWGFMPNLAAKRKEQQLSYFAFYTEKWANRLGEAVTHDRSMEQLVID